MFWLYLGFVGAFLLCGCLVVGIGGCTKFSYIGGVYFCLLFGMTQALFNNGFGFGYPFEYFVCRLHLPLF